MEANDNRRWMAEGNTLRRDMIARIVLYDGEDDVMFSQRFEFGENEYGEDRFRDWGKALINYLNGTVDKDVADSRVANLDRTLGIRTSEVNSWRDQSYFKDREVNKLEAKLKKAKAQIKRLKEKK